MKLLSSKGRGAGRNRATNTETDRATGSATDTGEVGGSVSLVGRLLVPVVALSATLFASPGFAQAEKPDPDAGAVIAQGVCAACHGPDGNSPLPVNPNLAGQHAEYT